MDKLARVVLWLTGFAAASAAFVAAVMTIVDYALNKPEVVQATFGPLNAAYRGVIEFIVAATAQGAVLMPAMLALISFLIGVVAFVASSVAVRRVALETGVLMPERDGWLLRGFVQIFVMLSIGVATSVAAEWIFDWLRSR